jgi:hypothetical protein
MFSSLSLLFILIALMIPAACFLYFFIFQIAITSALKESRGETFFNRLFLVFGIMIALAAYFFIGKPFSRYPLYELQPEEFNIGTILFLAGIAYLLVEIPYQLVKHSAHAVIDDLQTAGEDKRNITRLTRAQTLADIVAKKLQITCELQSFSSNDDFIFLTYILNNKPAATRLKIIQADNPESWKKLGEWLITSYQKENS